MDIGSKNSIFEIGMIKASIVLFLLFFASCQSIKRMNWPERTSSLTGTDFYHHAFAMKWAERDSFVLKEIKAGNIPRFLKKFIAVNTSIIDSSTGKIIKATYYAAPDYLSVGTDNDWARINITPNAAQQIADSFHCFLPTRKMVDDIYKAAKVKLEPVPMFAFRDSTPTMWHHHLIIEGQRKDRRGLIAGIKKDVVISGKISSDPRKNRVAIYGWHKLDGKPIQTLYTGHINWWVDYSQGIRLIYRKIKVEGKWMDYMDVLKDTTLQKLLCDEEVCDFYRYNY
ncbi:MAG TPA: hypothetical protein PLX74_10810 [Chitinophagaceae bacterium]|nr:hypothetical protein [Chitinophagaceae bacterium]